MRLYKKRPSGGNGSWSARPTAAGKWNKRVCVGALVRAGDEGADGREGAGGRRGCGRAATELASTVTDGPAAAGQKARVQTGAVRPSSSAHGAATASPPHHPSHSTAAPRAAAEAAGS